MAYLIDYFYNFGTKRAVACVGHGFVGSAVVNTFSQKCKVFVHDIRPVDNVLYCSDIPDTVAKLESESTYPVYFVCVPTPMKKATGECDTSIVESVLRNLAHNVSKKSIVIIKSTMYIGATRKLVKLYDNGLLQVIFNPEFLTERNAKQDFSEQKQFIFGSIYDDETNMYIKGLYEHAFNSNIDVSFVRPEEAEMSKLMLNCFWAVKVSFANEIFKICENANLDYETVKSFVLKDKRIGKTHMDVPGYDGQRGFGGVCLPKDLHNLISWAKNRGTETPLLNVVWDNNLNHREKHEWNEMLGRAVSDKM